MEFQIASRNYHHGQSDRTLLALIDGKVVGHIDYLLASRRVQVYQAKADAFDSHPTDEGRIWLNAIIDRWNALHQEIWELKRELHDMKPSKRLISP